MYNIAPTFVKRYKIVLHKGKFEVLFKCLLFVWFKEIVPARYISKLLGHLKII